MEDKEEMMGEDEGQMGMGSSMNNMMKSLQDKQGAEFDKSFMSAMMVHHQGAIEMAKEAKVKAQQAELKEMADDIIEAQTSEIDMMRQWQKTWGME